jgi:hypothetical protein
MSEALLLTIWRGGLPNIGWACFVGTHIRDDQSNLFGLNISTE